MKAIQHYSQLHSLADRSGRDSVGLAEVGSLGSVETLDQAGNLDQVESLDWAGNLGQVGSLDQVGLVVVGNLVEVTDSLIAGNLVDSVTQENLYIYLSIEQDHFDYI